MDEHQTSSEASWRQASDNVGHSPTMSDHVRHATTPLVARREEHTITMFEALKIFEQQGLPRSQRAIERYCKAEKLDCFFDVDEQRYYITQASIERLIGHLKEIQARQTPLAPTPTATDSVGHSPTTSDHVRPRSTMSENSEERKTDETNKRIKELEQEVLDLKITNKGKDYFIEQLQNDREAVVQERAQLIGQLTASVKEIGVLETKLLLLEAPKERIIDGEEGSMEGTQDYAR